MKFKDTERPEFIFMSNKLEDLIRSSLFYYLTLLYFLTLPIIEKLLNMFSFIC